MVTFVCQGPVCAERERELAKSSDGYSFHNPAPGTQPKAHPYRSLNSVGVVPSSSFSSPTNASYSFRRVPSPLDTRPNPSFASSLSSPWARSIRDNSIFNTPQNFSGAPLQIDKEGMVVNKRVIIERRPAIEHETMNSVQGIIVHQTGGSTAESALDSYKNKGAKGAHFLIDKDGKIYQTASIKKQTYHVGKLQSRCVFEMRCKEPKYNPAKENATEKKKPVPDRFPSNEDSIGIELVGEALPRGKNIPDDKKTYETVTEKQNSALSWLIGGLLAALQLPRTEIFRHPVVSRKNKTEASTAKW